MKKIGTIIILSLLFQSCTAQRYFYHLINRGVTARVVSDIKNIQPIPDSLYEAFGFTVQNKVNQATLYTNNATSHVIGAYPIYRTFNITARVWGDSTIIDAQDSLYSPVTSGGQMDNDSTVLFIVKNHTDIYHSRDIYIQKCDSNNHFSAPVLFNWTGFTQLQAGFFFGPLIHGDVPGESYAIMYQLNGDTGTTRRRITIFKTTDYWNHYAEQGVLYDVSGSPTQYSETAGVNLGGGNFLGITRNDQSGSLTPFESTNHGATWTRRPSSNLTWYNGGAPEIPWVYPHDGVFDFFYENRDATMMYISKGNTLASNFGSGSSYTQSEIYSFHKGTGGNPSLGYGSQLKLSTGLYLMLYFKEYTTAKANPQWTVDDLVTDPAGIPPAPTFTTGSITSTTFNVTITGQTDTTWQNIRYFSIDLSTHADFSDFVTAKYRATSAFSASVIQNTIALAGFVNFSALTTGTTYYFRIKACNNAGCSAYTTTSVSTPNDASVQQFLDSTGITDPTIISALNHYVVSEKADGGWAVCNAIYPMVGGTSATCAFNLKDPTLYKIAWNGSLTFDANGVIVNDQNSYGNTGIVPSSVLSLTSNHMSFYSATNVFTSSITDMGAGDGTRDVRLCIWSSSFNQGLYQLNDGTHTQLPFFSSNPGLAGWFLGTVTAANASAIYKNGVSLGTDAFGTCAALTNTYTIDLLNRNNAGSHTTGTDRKCSFATIGSGVSSTIAASMNTDIQTLQTALGR